MVEIREIGSCVVYCRLSVGQRDGSEWDWRVCLTQTLQMASITIPKQYKSPNPVMIELIIGVISM